MKLFEIENGIVKPTRESLVIYPFQNIWDRDTTEHKDIASKEIAFIEFYCSHLETNPYAGYFNDEVRKQKIINGIMREFPDWQPDGLILEGVAVYESLRDETIPTLQILKAALTAVDRIREYLENVDLTKTTKTGQLVNKPADVVATVGKLNTTVVAVNDLIKKVRQESVESTKTRGNRRINYFERMPKS